MITKINNRQDKRIVIEVEEAPESKGLAIVMHGLGRNRKSVPVRTIIESFLESGITTVSFDATNSYGQSGGKFEDATSSNYLEDLEEVIKWCKKQKWYKEPYWLAGRSLGALCITVHAVKRSKEVKSIISLSLPVSGRLLFKTDEYKDWEQWKKEGKHTWTSEEGIKKTLNWEYYEDVLKYDLAPYAATTKTPSLFIVGEDDKTTPKEHIEPFYNRYKGKKEFHIIKGASHKFRNKKHLDEIKKIMKKWIQSIK